MTVSELKQILDNYPNYMEIWVASGRTTSLLTTVSPAVDMDSNVVHLQLGGEYGLKLD